MYFGDRRGDLVLLHLGEHAVADLLPRLLVRVVQLGERLGVLPELLQQVAVGATQLLVDLVPADASQVIALRVEEQVLEERARRLRRRRLAGAELAVDVLECFLLRFDVVLLQRELDRGRVVEQRQDLVGGPAQRFQQHRDVLAPLAVDADADRVLLVDVELEPGSAARDDLGHVDVLVGRLVEILGEVGAGGTHELRHDDALGAVDDEGAPTRHDREVPHEDFLLLDLAGHLVHERGFDEQRLAVRDVLVAALLFRGLDVFELVAAEIQLELFGEIFDG